MVLNALDNVSARRHVNRICLASNTPLVESGTEGWLGQVQPIIQGKACYECTPQKPQTHFPICTIRSNPSKPIHTIVWAKQLFERIFGKPSDPDSVIKELSENLTDENEKISSESKYNDIIEKEQVTLTNERSKSLTHYIFHKVFHTDILLLIELDSYWEKVKPPTPYKLDDILNNAEYKEVKSTNKDKEALLEDQKVWSIHKSAETFMKSCEKLLELSKSQGLEWDKDQLLHLEFVTAASNLRSSQFNIETLSPFEVKSKAGNIIPAIATTNAIIAGLIVVEAIKIASGNIDQCKQSFIRTAPVRKQIFLTCSLEDKNPNCYVCTSNFVKVKLDTNTITLRFFIEEILKNQLNMLEPTIVVDNDIIYEGGEDSEEDFIDQLPKLLKDVRITHNIVIHVEDFLQDMSIQLSIEHCDKSNFENPDHPYSIFGEAKVSTRAVKENTASEEEDSDDLMLVYSEENIDDNDDLIVLDEEEKSESKKRKRDDDVSTKTKIQKVNEISID